MAPFQVHGVDEVSSATIRFYSTKLCIVEFGYNPAQKDIIKALAGADFDGQRWTVPVMHLPTLKTLFATLAVEPAVVDAYHNLLRQMIADLKGFERKKGIKALLNKHAVGIAAMKARQSQLSLTLG